MNLNYNPCKIKCLSLSLSSLSLSLFIYIYFNAHYLLVSRFTGVHFNMNCMNVHVLNIL